MYYTIYITILNFRIILLGVVGAVHFVGLDAGAVEAVGTDGFLGESDAVDERLDLAELEGGEFETTGYLGYHALVLGSAGCGIGLEIGVGRAFEVLYDLAGDQLHVALG